MKECRFNFNQVLVAEKKMKILRYCKEIASCAEALCAPSSFPPSPQTVPGVQTVAKGAQSRGRERIITRGKRRAFM